MKKTKKKGNTPRYKRMNHGQRLQAAKLWLPKFNGNNIVKGYKNHFGVDWRCAFSELELLGIKIDQEYKKQVLLAVEKQLEARRRRKQQIKEKNAQSFNEYIPGFEYGDNDNENFEYSESFEDDEDSEYPEYNDDTEKTESPENTGDSENVNDFDLPF